MWSWDQSGSHGDGVISITSYKHRIPWWDLLACSCHELVNIITRELTMRQGASGVPCYRLSVRRSKKCG